VGSITVSASQGTGPYTYSWNTNPAQSGATATGLSAGTYTVTATGQNGCSGALTTTLSVDSGSIAIATTNISPDNCNSAQGSASVLASGVKAPYSYSWSTNPAQSGATASNLNSGSYTVTVTDQYGCSAAKTIQVPDSNNLQVTISNVGKDSCGAGKGSALATVSGGSAPLSYQWAGNPGISGPQATGLDAGFYTVKVTDANGCSGVDSFTVDSTPNPTVTITNIDSPSCANSADGSAEAIAGGGTAPYSYTWNTSPVVTGSLLQGAGEGSFVVTAEDQFGCAAKDTLNLQAPNPPQITSTIGQPDTGGQGTGSATVVVSGGAPPYSFSWQSGSTDSVRTGLSAGDYGVTVTDANGCTVKDTVEVGDVTRRDSRLSAAMRVHPNPSRGQVTLQYQLPNSSPIDGALYDSRGRLVRVWNFEVAHQGEHELNLSQLSAGTYHLHLNSRFGKLTRKVILTQ
jgi:hypothetical protein